MEEERKAKHRPSEFKEEYINMADVYLAEKKDSVEIVNNKTIIKVNLPTIEGYASKIGVTKKTLYNWAKKHPKFLHSLKKIKNEQKERLINNGLGNTYNSTIAKLILSSNHGMREGTDITTDGKEMPTPIYNGLSRNELP